MCNQRDQGTLGRAERCLKITPTAVSVTFLKGLAISMKCVDKIGGRGCARKLPYSASLKSESGYSLRGSFEFRKCRNLAGITIWISPKANMEGADKEEENLRDIWIKNQRRSYSPTGKEGHD